MNNEKRTEYNKLIGRIGEKYYFLDDIFQYDDNFKGATGSVLIPLTEEECQEINEQANDDSELTDFWKQAVEADRTTDSLEDWCEQVRDEQGEDAGLDPSYRAKYMQILQKIKPDTYTTDCVGGGRCFDIDMEWDEIYNPELWELIKQAESK